MSVNLNPEIDGLVRERLQSGRYRDEDDVLREALSLLRQRDQLQADIALGLEELDRGEGIDSGEVFQELRERVARDR